MKYSIWTRTLSLLLAVLTLLALPAAALGEISAQPETKQLAPADLPEPEGESPVKTEQPDYVDSHGSYLPPEELAVYLMRRMEDTMLSNPKAAQERYTGVVAFYDYNETREDEQLGRPYFFYYEKGELKDEEVQLVTAKGYLDLTQAPVAESTVNAAAEDGARMVYVGEEVYVDQQAGEHPDYLFVFGQQDVENGLFTGTYQQHSYQAGLIVAQEPEVNETQQLDGQPVGGQTPAGEPLPEDPETPQDPEDPQEPEDPQDPEDPQEPETPEQPVVEKKIPVVTVKAPQGAVAQNGIQVKWDTDPNATGFRLFRKEGNGGWKGIADLTSGETVSYLDTGAVSGKTYAYTARAYYADPQGMGSDPYNSGNWSGYTPSGNVYYLEAPQFTLSSEDTKIVLSWNKIAGATAYRVYRCAQGESGWTALKKVDSDTVTYTDEKAEKGVNYFYTVKAINETKNFNGPYLDQRSDSTKAICLHATPVVEAASVAGGVKISWGKDAMATGYRVYRKPVGGSNIVLTNITAKDTTSFVDQNVKNNQTFVYSVRAYYGDVEKMKPATTAQAELWSKGSKSVTHIYMDAPQFTATYSDNGFMRVEWNSVPNATGYRIYRRTSPTASWSVVGYVTSGTVYQDKNVKNGTSYYYAIRSYQEDAKGNRYFSINTNQTEPSVYHAPLTVTVATVGNGCKITWNLDPKATGYRINRKSSGGNEIIANIPATSVQSGATNGTFTDPAAGLTSGQTYQYAVRAYYGPKAIGSAPAAPKNDWSGFGWNKTIYLDTPKVNVAAGNDATGLKVGWKTVTGAAGYYIYRKIGSGGWKKVGQVTSGATNAYIDTTATKLAAGTVCYYTIVAFSAKEASRSYYDTTGAYAIYLPKPQDAEVGAPNSSGTKITWTAVPGADSYRIYRKPMSGGGWTQLSEVTGTVYVDTAVTNPASRFRYTIRPCKTTKLNGKDYTVLGCFHAEGYATGIFWEGKERQSWARKNGSQFYVDKNGCCLTGWQYLVRNNRKYKYYFDPKTGALVTNLYRYFGKEYRDLPCKVEIFLSQSSSSPSHIDILLLDSATNSYCIPAASFRCVASLEDTYATTKARLIRANGQRWLHGDFEGAAYEQYGTRISGSGGYFHSVLYTRDNPNRLQTGTYNSLASNVNNSLGCIRMQCIYAYLIQDIMKNGYGLRHNIPVSLHKTSRNPGPFGIPRMDKINGGRRSDPTDPAITGKFYYDTTVHGVKATAGAGQWTFY